MIYGVGASRVPLLGSGGCWGVKGGAVVGRCTVVVVA